jgi:hypothetical protein
MVFQKLSDTDREQLAIFGQDHDKKQVAMMRALIMRGASPNEAKTMAGERQKARDDLVEALKNEKQQRDEEEEEEEEEEEVSKPKAKRTPRKLKLLEVKEDEEEVVAPPPPSPKIKRTRSKKIPTPNEELRNDAENQITILA